ncbi:restriction endonuclease subunit S [Flavobacteriaceae bacterium]|nr:restriction endonuclease subunit S [Flavobacteriaceae bacterium]
MIEHKKFGEVCDFVRGPFGGSLKKSFFVEEGYAVYEQKHAIYDQFSEIRYFVDEKKFNEMKRFELKPNDLIMSCSGTMGKVAIVPGNIKKGIINQALLKLTPKDFLDVKYLKYWMNSPDFDNRIQENTVGAAIKNVASVKVLKQIDVPIPPLEEQHLIIKLLDEALAKVDQAIANIERNIENANELFQSKLNDIFSQKGDDWEEKTLKEVCSVITDGTHQTPKYFDSGYIFLSSKNVTSGKIDWENIKYLDEEQHNKMYKRLAPQINDILLAKNGTTGVAAIVDVDKVFDIYVSLALLRPTEIIFPYYLLHFINSVKAKKQFNKRLKGIGVPNLHLNEIREVVINFPKSLEEQKEYANYIDKLLSHKELIETKYDKKLIELEDLKKSILQKAFAGELTQSPVAI